MSVPASLALAAASPGAIAAATAFTASPIILTGGLATYVGGYLPILYLTGSGVLNSLIAGTPSATAFAAQFVVQAGGSLIKAQYGQYPFANQTVAANAMIADPLRVSVLMHVPANDTTGGYPGKLALMQALQAGISQHLLLGGMFTVLTPGYTYSNMLLEAITDASAGDDMQVQYDWRWDFWQPLVTQAQATTVQGLLGQVNQTPPTGSVNSPAGTSPQAYGVTSVNAPSPAPPGGP